MVIIKMIETKSELSYAERLKKVRRNKSFWSAEEVRQRMLAKGFKKGAGLDNIWAVLNKEKTENIKVLTAAEEVIKIRQQVLIKDPISLRTKEEIIEEYNSKLNALKATLSD